MIYVLLFVTTMSIVLNILLFIGMNQYVNTVQTQLKILEKKVFPNFPWNEELDRNSFDTVPGRIRRIWLELSK